MVPPNAPYIEYANLLFVGIYATWLLIWVLGVVLGFFSLGPPAAAWVFQLSPMINNLTLATALAPATVLFFLAINDRASGPHLYISIAYLAIYSIYLLIPDGVIIAMDGSLLFRKPILLFSTLLCVPTIFLAFIQFRTWRPDTIYT